MAINKQSEISGAGQYPANRLNQRERKVLEVSNQFDPSTPSDWESAPATIDEALDSLAATNSGGALKSTTATYDFSVQGGAIGSHSLAVSLPDNAIIVETIIDVLTPVVGSGTVQLTVPTDGALQANDIDSGDSAGPLDDSLAAPKKLTAARTMQATIAGAIVTAGKIQYFVRYYQGE